MTTTTRERFEEKFCFKQTDDGVTHYPSLRTNIDQTESIWSFIETIEKEAEERGVQRGREEMRKECIEVVKTKTPWRQTRYISCLTHSISSLK